MLVLRLSVFLSVFLTTGCGSIIGRFQYGFSPYIGPQTSMEAFTKPTPAEAINPFVYIVWYPGVLVDAGLSAVVDTLILPFDLWLQKPEETTNKQGPEPESERK